METYGDKTVPIAIIGVGGRFPGSAINPQKLWDLLAQGQHSLIKTPADRYNVDAFYHPNGERIGAQHFDEGCFMQGDPSVFDAPFFSMTPGEAKAMDPQQRMCLEVAYEAMENAGLHLSDVRGTRTAVFVGTFTKDYRSILAHDPQNYPWHFATGVSDAAMSNRVSWFYDLRGPSMTLDTACSSSLIALHLACQSLRTGESQMALVGGVNFMCFPEYNATMSTMHFLGPDGRSKSFDQRANGYGRGEGCSFVMIKPLENAIRDGNVIRAVIRNTGCNQDGHTPGFAFPSGEAQVALIRDVFDGAGLDMADTGYFEAHGSGTAVGDRTEISAIGATIGASRPLGDPVWVGSIKANVGHLEGASGIAGVVKALFVLENAKIPPQVWLEKINPQINLAKCNVTIPTQLIPWPKKGLRRVGINSFGFGGANAFAVLDDAYHYLLERSINARHNTITNTDDIFEAAVAVTPDINLAHCTDNDTEGNSAASELLAQHGPDESRPLLLVWSAHEQSGVDRVAASYLRYMKDRQSSYYGPGEDFLLKRLVFTAGKHRSVMPWRSFAVAASLDAMQDSLQNPLPPFRSSSEPKLAFIFTGQGAQWYAMGRELMCYEIFSRSLFEASTFLCSKLGCSWILADEFLKDETSSSINLPSFSQPICTALQIAMVELLQSWGITPTAVAGHSSGEIAAAFAKGAISKQDAWRIAYYRGVFAAEMKTLAPDLKGGMLAVGLDLDEAREYVEKVTAGTLSIACINSPVNVTVAGDQAAVDQLEVVLRAEGKYAKKLKVSIAYHSSHMQLISKLYLESIQQVETLPQRESSPIMFSSVTGDIISNCELDQNYWVDNMLQTVQFSPAIKALTIYSEMKARRGQSKPLIDVLVELGPHGALQGPIKQILSALKSNALTLSALNRGENAAFTVALLCGRLFQQGYPVDIEAFNATSSDDDSQKQMLVDVPPYPWNHNKRYWHESAITHNFRFRKFPRDDLIGVRVQEGNDEQPCWRQFLRVSENPWLEDHVVHNTLIFPACGMAAMAIQAASQIADLKMQLEGYQLRDMVVNNAMIIPRNDEGLEVSIRLQPWRNGSCTTSNHWTEFSISSRAGKETWANNCFGLIKIVYVTSDTALSKDELAAVRAKHKHTYSRAASEATASISHEQFYSIQKELGVDLRDAFRNVVTARKGPAFSCCDIKIPDLASNMPETYMTSHVIHPCVLDSLLTALLPAVELKTATIPTYIGSLFVSADIPSDPGVIFQSYGMVNLANTYDTDCSTYAALQGWEKPLVAFERVRMTGLADKQDLSMKGTENSGQRRITGQIDWQVDITKIERPILQSECDVAARHSSKLIWLTKLLAHKNPALKILDLAAGNGCIAKLLVDALISQNDQDPLIESYTISGLELKDLPSYADWALSGHQARLLSRSLDVSSDPLKQGFKAAEFDLIIATAFGAEGLDNLKILLRPGGRLVMAELKSGVRTSPANHSSLETDLPAQHWDTTLRDTGFSGIDLVSTEVVEPTNEIITFLVSTLPAKHTELARAKVIVITPDSVASGTSRLASGLSQALRKAGVEVELLSLQQLSTKSISDKTIVYLETEQSLLIDLEDDNFEALRSFMLCARRTIWVTRGGTIECTFPELGLASGLIRTVRSETPAIDLSIIDLDPSIEIGSESNIDALMKFLSDNSGNDVDSEFALRNGCFMIPRIKLAKSANDLLSLHHAKSKPEPTTLYQEGRALTLAIEKPSMLETLFFKADPVWQQPLQPTEVELEIKASGLNFMDVMVGLGQIRESGFGLECSGVVSRVGMSVQKFRPGDRVMTWLLGGIGNFARNIESMIQPLPKNMSFEYAASLPMIVTTAYTALVVEARLQKGEKILIHSAAGGVGQAAIQISLHIGAEVFATVSSEDKKQHIMQRYEIPADHIFSSRNLTFVDGIKQKTDGKGVDVVLNSLAGEALRQSWHCLRWFGRFIELGKRDMFDNSGLDMSVFLKNTSFHAVNIIGMLQADTDRASELFSKAMEFVHLGFVVPVDPVTILKFSQIEEGFRLLQSGKHMGKIVFQANADDIIQAPPRRIREAAFSDNATYVLSGGLGGIGRSLSRWMAKRGAKYMVFLGRSGDSKAGAKEHVKSLIDLGINVRVFACDIGDASAIKSVAKTVGCEMPPVRGILQVAMSLADAAYTNMTPKQWRLSVNPKAAGTLNLHRFFPNDVDFFVTLASSSGIIGNPGQSNYAAGNTFQDALAHHRISCGLKATTIDCGPVLGAGYLAEDSTLLETLARQGGIALHENEIITLVQAAITGETIDGNKMPTQLVTGFATGGYVATEGLETPFYHDDAKFHHIRNIDIEASSSTALASATWQVQLSAVTSLTQASKLVSTAIQERLSKLLMISPEDIDQNKPVSTYGIDSLTAVELRGWCFRDLQSDISIFDIISKIPLSSLARNIASKSKFIAKEVIEADT